MCLNSPREGVADESRSQPSDTPDHNKRDYTIDIFIAQLIALAVAQELRARAQSAMCHYMMIFLLQGHLWIKRFMKGDFGNHRAAHHLIRSRCR